MKWMIGFVAGALAVLTSAAALPLPIFVYVATLSGPGEAPPNASTGTGFAEVIPYPTTNIWRIKASFSGLSGTSAAAHIHCCVADPGTAAVATQVPVFINFPLGVTSGTYDQLFDMSLSSSYSPGFLAANGNNPLTAEATLLAALQTDMAYFNIHTAVYPGGEIRGFFHTVVIDRFPEPATLALLGAGVLGAFGARRRLRAAVGHPLRGIGRLPAIVRGRGTPCSQPDLPLPESRCFSTGEEANA